MEKYEKGVFFSRANKFIVYFEQPLKMREKHIQKSHSVHNAVFDVDSCFHYSHNITHNTNVNR